MSTQEFKHPFVYDGITKVPKDVTSVIFDTSNTNVNTNVDADTSTGANSNTNITTTNNNNNNNNTNINEITDYAFKDCKNLTNIIIPPTITHIGNYAFYNCYNLKSVIFPKTLKEIGNAAFDGCSSLTSVIIPSASALSSSSSLSSSSTTTTEDLSSITKIRYRCFYRCTNLISVFLPLESIRDIRNNAFSDCESLILVCIPPSVKTVLYSAFDNCESCFKELTKDDERHVDDYGNSIIFQVMKNENVVEEFLEERFDDLPLHRLCYYYATVKYSDTYEYGADDNVDDVDDGANNNVDTTNTATVATTNDTTTAHLKNDRNNDKGKTKHKGAKSSTTATKTISKTISKATSIMDEIRHMILNNPQAIQSIDQLGMTPLHILSCYCTCSSPSASPKSTGTVISTGTVTGPRSDVSNLNYNKSYYEIAYIMNQMIDLFPNIAQMKNCKGMTPLDLYIKCCCCCFLDDGSDSGDGKSGKSGTATSDSANVTTNANTDCVVATKTIVDNHHDYDYKYEYEYLPLCLLIKMGMKWNNLQQIISLSPDVPLQRGINQFMEKHYTCMHTSMSTNTVTSTMEGKLVDNNENVNNNNSSSSNYSIENDFDLYPFMQAAVQGDLESLYNLALYRIDLLH